MLDDFKIIHEVRCIHGLSLSELYNSMINTIDNSIESSKIKSFEQFSNEYDEFISNTNFPYDAITDDSTGLILVINEDNTCHWLNADRTTFEGKS